jgi:hypothetical protein
MLSFERSETRGDTTLHFFADEVVYIQHHGSGPPEPPAGENWLVPRGGGTSRFAYWPQTGIIVFYHTLKGEYPHYHGGALANLWFEFGLDWPPYDKWVRGIVSQKAIKFPIVNLAGGKIGGIDKKKAYRNLRNALRRLAGLGGIPDDYRVRVFHEDNKRTATKVRDWIKCGT